MKQAALRTAIWCVTGLLLVTLAAWVGPFFISYGYDTMSLNAQFQPPSFLHWMGTDVHGRDVLTRVLYGARVSLLVGIVGASVSLFIGVIYGLVSGYVGGRTDQVMMRFVDIVYSLPRIVIVISLISLLDSTTRVWLGIMRFSWLIEYSRIVILIASLGLVEWLTMARIIRGQVLSLRERTFVQAAEVLGQKPFTIMVKHLLPNLSGVILIYLTLTVPAVILDESLLSFLGLGVQAPASSWGTMLSDGASLINPVKSFWWLLLGPASFVAVTLLCLNFLGDALRDLFDPRTSKKE